MKTIKKRISAPQLKQQTIALIRYAQAEKSESFQNTLDIYVNLGLQSEGIESMFNKLTPEEKNEFTKGLELRY